MGTYTPPPPQPALTPELDRPERPWWSSPILLGGVAVLIAGVAYKVGHHEETPSTVRPASAVQVVERPPIIYVLPGAPAAPAAAVPVSAPVPAAEPAPAPPISAERQGVAVTTEAPPPPSQGPLALKEKIEWTKTELSAAKAALVSAQDANPHIYNRNGGLLVVAETHRNAALTSYQVRVNEAERAWAAVLEECRTTQGCPASWCW